MASQKAIRIGEDMTAIHYPQHMLIVLQGMYMSRTQFSYAVVLWQLGPAWSLGHMLIVGFCDL